MLRRRFRTISLVAVLQRIVEGPVKQHNMWTEGASEIPLRKPGSTEFTDHIMGKPDANVPFIPDNPIRNATATVAAADLLRA